MGSPVIWGGNGALNLQAGGLNLTSGQQLRNDGPKNYLANPLAETGTTTGWSLGNVSLTSAFPTGTPTFGSGASGNLTLAATSTTPLSGTYSFSYTSSAATTAGNFIASDAFTVDKADLGKVLGVQFSYQATSNGSNGNWSGTSANSFRIAIYDVTLGSANWILPAGIDTMIQNAGAGVATAYFQTSVTVGQQYRIVIFNGTATSGAITVYFDQLFVGPSSAICGPGGQIGLIANGTPVSATANAIIVYPTISNDSAAGYNTSTGEYTVPITGFYHVGGGLGITTNTGFNLTFYVNGVFRQAIGETSGGNPRISGYGLAYVNAGDKITIRSDTSVTPSGTATAINFFNVVYAGSGVNGIGTGSGLWPVAKMHLSANASTGTATSIPFDVKDFDNTNSLTTGTGAKFTAPVTGYYQVSGFVDSTANGVTFVLYKNGSIFEMISGIFSGNFGGGYGTVVNLNAGDTIDIRGGSTFTAAGSASAGADRCSVCVQLIGGGSVAAPAATVAARYFASATSISGSLATVVWTTKDFDTTNSMSSGVYTIPVSGKYQVNAFVATTGTFALNSQLIIEIQKNSSVVSREKNYAGGVVTDLTGAINDIISCNAGDTIRIQLSSAATGPSIISSDFENYFSISRVGN